MFAYIYQLTDTVNSIVNIEKLDLEIRASGLDWFVTPPYLVRSQAGESRLFIEFSQLLDADGKLALDQIVTNHDGQEADVSESRTEARELKIRELTEMAILHPLLDNDLVVAYLTSIDNWFNAWKRSGINSALIAKITEDAANVAHPQNGLLNTVVNTDGHTTAQFLISKVQ